jgi:hypothetical protein
MNVSAIDLSILLPALVAGLLVTATHVPLGAQVLSRGIVFIDLAIAQIAGCGVSSRTDSASSPKVSPCGRRVAAALLGAAMRRGPSDVGRMQEAVIGVVFSSRRPAESCFSPATRGGGIARPACPDPGSNLASCLTAGVWRCCCFGSVSGHDSRAGFYIVFACAS